ncbi:MAG: transcriptional repressor LexA [Dehalococcoidia bacterium]
MRDLSPKQQKIYTFIRQFVEDRDYPPSIRDIQSACGISSTSVVDYNLKALERQGLIRRDREISRAIELLDNGRRRRQRTLAVPVLGAIAAGSPIPVPNTDTFAEVATADTVDVAEEMTGGHDDVFALRVKGTSMIDALINDGDLVLLRATTEVRDGDMVAVWIKSQGETTLKRFYHEGARIRLQPANSTMQPIYVDAADVEVQGKVVSTNRPPQTF